ncbi:MAG: BatA domain-containing protein [Robiginitalea sp.]
MQLQHPELLWGLLLLIIPILVHLLRLRRFRTTPFTNVKVLERILAESNKSSRLKKWLLLISRLGILTAIVLGFCQPYIPSYNSDKKKDIVVYLDNSFSMQARGDNTNLLQQTVQEVLQYFPPDLRFTLMTNSDIYTGIQVKDIQERLLNLNFSAETMTLETLRLRAATLFSGSDSAARQLWLLSDFRGWDKTAWKDWGQSSVMAVQQQSQSKINSILDTVYIRRGSPENLELTVRLSKGDVQENLPVSLYNGDTLLAKTGSERLPDGTSQARFTIPEAQVLKGSIQISDEGLAYDNILYLTLNQPRKIEVVSIGPEAASYLERIFTPESFNLKQSTLRGLDYSDLERQHLILLNELEEIPPPLLDLLPGFIEQGGNLVIIPSENARIESYNRLMEPLGAKYQPSVPGDILISEIYFDHPLFRDVFEKPIDNFEYPKSASFYPLAGNFPQIIAYQNGQPFLSGREGIYIFAGALSAANSNFQQSPLIVPTFYAIGKKSLPGAELYYQIGREAQLDLNVSLQEDEILEVVNPDYSFIPMQRSFARKTRLSFGDEPSIAGNYQIENQGEIIQDLSFNYSRKESYMASQPVALPDSFEVYPDVKSLATEYQNRSRNTSLWKWFVILALLFVLAEMILQKTMR